MLHIDAAQKLYIPGVLCVLLQETISISVEFNVCSRGDKNADAKEFQSCSLD